MVPRPSYWCLLRLNKICTGVAVQRKNQFMQRLHNYWLLKRQSKNGMPLIRRLHSHLQAHKTTELVRLCRKPFFWVYKILNGLLLLLL